jgi:peptidoglycan/LPS O-acetylase OafA/YrhL
MPVRRLLAAAVLTSPVLVDPAVGSSALTPGRLWSLIGAAVGVAGVVAGVVALARPSRSGRRGRGAVVAGLVGGGIGGAVVAAAEGGPNTGYGIVGGFVALGVGLVAVVLGGLALLRSRRAVRPAP